MWNRLRVATLPVVLVVALMGIWATTLAQDATPVAELPTETVASATSEPEFYAAAVGGGITSIAVSDLVGTTFRIDFAFEADDDAQPGDTITFTNESSSTNTFVAATIPLYDDLGNLVGAAEVTLNQVVITLSDFVATHDNVRGSGWFTGGLTSPVICSTQEQRIPISFGTASGTIISELVVAASPSCGPIYGLVTKTGYPGSAEPLKILWYANGGTEMTGSLRVTDTLGAGHEMLCESLYFYGTGTMTVVSCDASGFTLQFDNLTNGADFSYITQRTDAGPDYSNCLVRTQPIAEQTCGYVWIDSGGQGSGDDLPTRVPVETPTVTATATTVPTSTPTATATMEPTSTPTTEPTSTPTTEPTNTPTTEPTNTPTTEPTSTPTTEPTNTPTTEPTNTPTTEPTNTPTTEPTNTPTTEPTNTPTTEPTGTATTEPPSTATVAAEPTPVKTVVVDTLPSTGSGDQSGSMGDSLAMLAVVFAALILAVGVATRRMRR